MVCCRTERRECGWPHTATAMARCSTPFWMSPVASSSSPSCTSYTRTNYLTKQQLILTSVADPGCLSRIPDPDFYPSRIPDTGSRIPDPKTATKERGDQKFVVMPFHKIEIIYYWNAEENNLAQFSKNYRTFYPKNCQKAFKNIGLGSGIRDPGSGKNIFRIPDPGVKKAPDPGSESATLILTGQ